MEPLSILTFIILIFLSAFFSGTEIALMTTSKHAVSSLVRENRFGARSLEIIKGNTDKLLITILIGNNIVNTASATLAATVALNLAQASGLNQEQGMVISTAVVTILLLLFGEITPKTICTRYGVPIALFVAPIYRVLMFVFTPISFFIEIFLKGIMKIFGGDNFVKKISYQEVEAFIDMSHEEGEVQADEHRQMKNLLSLRDMDAESVMTPRVNVNFLDMEMTVDEACEFFLQNSHSRMPVAGKNTDDVDFMLTFREAFQLRNDGQGMKKLSEISLEKIMKIPLTQTLDDLFEKFQKSRRHMALVFDEFGGTAGLITMEDILEEVFGDIKDEVDQEEIFMKKKSDTMIEAVGSVLIDDILEEFGMRADDLEIPSEYMGETISYVVMAEEESFPTEGVEVIFGNDDEKLSLTVLSVHHNVIEKIECRKILAEEKK